MALHPVDKQRVVVAAVIFGIIFTAAFIAIQLGRRNERQGRVFLDDTAPIVGDESSDDNFIVSPPLPAYQPRERVHHVPITRSRESTPQTLRSSRPSNFLPDLERGDQVIGGLGGAPLQNTNLLACVARGCRHPQGVDRLPSYAEAAHGNAVRSNQRGPGVQPIFMRTYEGDASTPSASRRVQLAMP